ncbi:MAG: FKBP-type peptidyl-prolyl cis-trans isomerase [Jatrophihabitantaceae bacterium]
MTALALGATVALAGCAGKDSPADVPTTMTASASATPLAEVSFSGVTLDDAGDLTAKPKVISKSATTPTALQVKDVVTGTGVAATPESVVTVQYVGVRYADGKQFDASWDHGGATSFSLREVVPGFTQGIGGAPGAGPMKVGGRRIMILPAALGYGRTGNQDGSIPPNAPIVFVVDLIAVK